MKSKIRAALARAAVVAGLALAAILVVNLFISMVEGAGPLIGTRR